MSPTVSQQKMLVSRNPANLQVLGEVSMASREEILSRVAAARQAFNSWSQLTVAGRLAYIERFRSTLGQASHEVARLITLETGKPLIESYTGELFGPLDTCSWLFRNAEQSLQMRSVSLNPLFFLGKRSYDIFEPLGVVAVISPWNYPFSIPVSSILTALVAGNTVVLKPSPKTPLVALKIAELFDRAGFPKGVVSVVNGDREEAKTLVLSDVDRVVFTGSVGGGRAIMELAAKKLHPITLELGGKHPALVLADANLEMTAKALVWLAFTNAGQACVSVERVYAERPIAQRLGELVTSLSKRLRLGDGLNPETDVGPMIDGDQLQRIKGLVDDATAAGARLLAGGKAREDLGGHFFEPTVLADVRQDMRVIREEIFGPILPIVTVDSAEEAVRLANDSPLALGASIWTEDLDLAEALARRIRAGMVWINDGMYSHGCPDAPWGGIKDSGFGRMHGANALHEFVYVKHIGVDRARQRDWQYPYCPRRLSLMQAALGLLHGKGWQRLKAGLQTLKDWVALR